VKEKVKKISSWIFVRLVLWGTGAFVGYVIATNVLPQVPDARAFAAGPFQVNWGFTATVFGCLALGLLLWRDPSWPNKVAWALSLAVAFGAIAPEEAQVIASITGFVIPVAIMILKAFFGGRKTVPQPAAQPQQAAPATGTGIGFSGGISLPGGEQLDLAGILADREQAARQTATAEMLKMCERLIPQGGQLGTMASVLSELVLTEELARRGILLVSPEEATLADQEEQPQERDIRRGRAQNPLMRLIKQRRG